MWSTQIFPISEAQPVYFKVCGGGIMPPFLRDGVPVNQPEPPKPSHSYLFICFECVEHTSWDPITSTLINGQYVSQKTLMEHKWNEKMRQRAIQNSLMKGGHIVDLPEQLSTQSLHQGAISGGTSTRPASCVGILGVDFEEKKANHMFYYDLMKDPIVRHRAKELQEMLKQQLEEIEVHKMQDWEEQLQKSKMEASSRVLKLWLLIAMSSIVSSIPSDVRTVMKVLDLKPPTTSYNGCCPSLEMFLNHDVFIADNTQGDDADSHFMKDIWDGPTLEHIEDLDYGRWESRTCEEHRRLAQAWQDAPSEDERNALFQQTGIRWSELLCLPYWDPTMFLNLRRHCHNIWVMDVKFEDGDGITYDITSGKALNFDDMQHGYHVFQHGSRAKLFQLRVEVMYQICREAGLRFGGKKKKLGNQLVNHWIKMSWFDKAHKGGNSAAHSSQETKQNCNADFPDDFGDALLTLENSHTSSSAIKKLHKVMLVSLCVAKFEHGRDHNALTKTALAQDLMVWHKKHVLDASSNIDIAIDSESLHGILKSELVKAMGVVNAPDVTHMKLTWLKKAVLLALCTVKLRNDINSQPHKTTAVQNKAPEPMSKKHSRNSKMTHILGKGTLGEVWKDIKIITLPSNVATAPKAIGSARHGKLSADQWWTTCTINLVYTLICLWGNEPKDSKRYSMLSNFMDLHLSIHLANLFNSWGPAHAWKCFPFEHFNYKLQGINTNMKFGDLEATMSTRFCQEQRLRALFEDNTAPGVTKTLCPTFERAFNHDTRGTLKGDMIAFKCTTGDSVTWTHSQSSALSKPISQLLSAWLNHHPQSHESGKPSRAALRGLQLKSISIGDYDYKTAVVSPCDSYLIYSSSSSPIWFAGQIQDIFTYGHRHGDKVELVQHFVVLCAFKSLSSDHAVLDPFRAFQLAGGQLFYASFEEDHVLIPLGDIICPFAHTLYTLDIKAQAIPCIHALPLDKYCKFIKVTWIFDPVPEAHTTSVKALGKLGCLLDFSEAVGFPDACAQYPPHCEEFKQQDTATLTTVKLSSKSGEEALGKIFLILHTKPPSPDIARDSVCLMMCDVIVHLATAKAFDAKLIQQLHQRAGHHESPNSNHASPTTHNGPFVQVVSKICDSLTMPAK
ncbi:hypothetical protein F4604DRAFT_1685900 [Suillus subluteus]|nr:hypothetical protein F4604DRAFT_1685900 [Suillus subluteus]